MRKPKIKIGDVFSKLTVISACPEPSDDQSKHLVMCNCGTPRLVSGKSLKAGNTRSCGCLRGESNTTHGLSKTSEYGIWTSMIRRCYNSTHDGFESYGGRGITVCEDWSHFENFLRDMGPRPNKLLSLDRINNDGNYEPGNCRWATRFQQAINKRTKPNRLSIRTGVRFHQQIWEASITMDRKPRYLGRFDSLLDAACARISAENKYHRPRML